MRRIKTFGVHRKILFAALLIFSCSNSVTNENFVAYVNGEGISTKMFKQQMAKYKAAVYSHFSQAHIITSQGNFWYTSFGENEIPIEILKKQALDECLKIITHLSIAKQKGLLKDISYDGLINQLKDVNESRKQAVNEKKVIYGPVEYTESMFLDHLLGLIIIELKTKFSESELNISDQKLLEFYENNKAALYKSDENSNGSEYYAFDSVKALVKSNYVDRQYDQLVNHLISSAEVSINEKIYESITVE